MYKITHTVTSICIVHVMAIVIDLTYNITTLNLLSTHSTIPYTLDNINLSSNKPN